VFDITGWSPALYAHVENNLRILAAFRYSTYPGRVVLFRARTRPLFHAHARDLGWSGFAREVEVIEVPGNHHTMTTEPHIRVLAKKLRAAVEQ
jgi:thioesterase domain-containing protein